jgi:large subunit ribosomal protein L4
MADIPVIDAKGKKKGTHSASDAVFAAEVKPHIIRLAVNAFLTNQRQGNASVKTRSTVSGGGRKPFKQKGTGRARQGTIRAPNMRGGAVVHGPATKTWSQRLNRKVRRQAMTSALSSLVASEAVRAVDDFKMPEPKTKAFAKFLGKLGLDSTKVLLLLEEQTPAIVLSARNLPNVSIVLSQDVNVYDLVTHDQVITTVEALTAIENRLGGEEAN